MKTSIGDELTMTALHKSLHHMIERSLTSNLSSKNTAVNRQRCSGIQLHVDSPTLDLSWSGAFGYTDNSHKEAISPQHPMRIASVTKTYVAAGILRLWEQHQLDLDASINGYISDHHNQCLTAQAYDTGAITIRHCLTHTSGLFDYADSPEFTHAVLANPEHHWTRTEQLQLAMDKGNAYGIPGDVYRYSDTGYILLGEIIERVYGQPLGLALRELLNYKKLGLTSTWLEVYEPTPGRSLSRVHQYVGEQDYYAVHGSADLYGGGGLVSTVGEMARFMRALFNHEVYSSPNTLEEMLTSVDARIGGPDAYGGVQVPGTCLLGIHSDKGVFNHSGFFGTYAAYVPAQDLAIGLSVNQHHAGALMRDIVAATYQLLGVDQ